MHLLLLIAIFKATLHYFKIPNVFIGAGKKGTVPIGIAHKAIEAFSPKQIENK